MSGHTPGPWEARESWVFAGEQMVAFATELHADGSSTSTKPIEFANARLIAAAPDFVAACLGKDEDVTPLQWLRALLSDLHESGPRDDNEDPMAWLEALAHSEMLLADLDAVIAKVEDHS